VVLVGLLAGIFVDYFANQGARSALNASSFIQYQQIMHQRYAGLIPPVLIASVIAAVVWLVMIWQQWRSAEFWLVVATIGGMVIVFVVTGAVSAPINDQLMTWSIEAPPAELKSMWAPWEKANLYRTAAAVLAFVFSVVALGLTP
jgi:hypothetical protein